MEKQKHNFKNLKIWQSAMSLSKDIFTITKNFSKKEIFGLRSQINRCCVSIPSNIAEGSSRSSNKDFYRFLEISLGSLYELQTQIILSFYQNYINQENVKIVEEKIIDLQKMISGFQKSLLKT